MWKVFLNPNVDKFLNKLDKNWTEKELKLLKRNYDLNSNLYNLFSNRTRSSINHKASRLGIKRSFRNRKYFVNHNFFKKQSPEMAYILGWFFSDGNVSTNNYCISIHLNKKDHYILEEISQILENNRPIYKYNNSSYLRIDSKVLANDLIDLGCIPKKSHKLKFPNIKNKFISHFIRGYFDGDGSIHFNKPNTIKISFLGTEQFLEKLRSKINNKLNIKMNPITKLNSIFVLYYYGDDARKLCHWMYKNSKDLYLVRKKYRFEKHLRLREK